MAAGARCGCRRYGTRVTGRAFPLSPPALSKEPPWPGR
ncbi:hypothetical protein SNL152K_3192 [Streptomyces sp. NL15-2K]|nr:hypothetical protein SNL152K_3192 [Streptomyces sp. NL15-2K]